MVVESEGEALEPPPSPTSTAALICTTVHPDILVTHIFSRLDGLTLTLLSSTSSDLRGQIGPNQSLWREICLSMWPSIQKYPSPISSFTNGYRGFFSNSYPILTGNYLQQMIVNDVSFRGGLISAIDIHYDNKLIFSRVQEKEIFTQGKYTTTSAGTSSRSPFNLQVVNPKESLIPLPIKSRDHRTLLKAVEEKLELSWIIIDPGRNRAVNISSVRPVSVQRNWISGEVEVKYSTIVNYNSPSTLTGLGVGLEVGITCSDGEGTGHLHVGEVWMHMEDVDGNRVNMKESVEVLASLMECGERKKRRVEKDYLWRHREYVQRKTEWREREQIIRRKKILYVAGCYGVIVTLFLSICSLFCYM